MQDSGTGNARRKKSYRIETFFTTTCKKIETIQKNGCQKNKLKTSIICNDSKWIKNANDTLQGSMHLNKIWNKISNRSVITTAE